MSDGILQISRQLEASSSTFHITLVLQLMTVSRFVSRWSYDVVYSRLFYE